MVSHRMQRSNMPGEETLPNTGSQNKHGKVIAKILGVFKEYNYKQTLPHITIVPKFSGTMLTTESGEVNNKKGLKAEETHTS